MGVLCDTSCQACTGVDVGDQVLAKIKAALKEGTQQTARPDPPVVKFTPLSVMFPPETGSGARITFGEFDLKHLEVNALVQVIGRKRDIAREIAAVARGNIAQKATNIVGEKAVNAVSAAKNGAVKAASAGFGKLKNAVKGGSEGAETSAGQVEDDSALTEEEMQDSKQFMDAHNDTKEDEEVSQDVRVVVLMDVKKSLSLGEDVQVKIVEIRTLDGGVLTKVLNQPQVQKGITSILSKKISAAANKKMGEKLAAKGLK